ncbi:hypothetical protein GGP47_000671, partial [Salinibacter ruber]|nr:hypothetical protein [Salinibacter ruber]
MKLLLNSSCDLQQSIDAGCQHKKEHLELETAVCNRVNR